MRYDLDNHFITVDLISAWFDLYKLTLKYLLRNDLTLDV
jgi:hypothetical protein